MSKYTDEQKSTMRKSLKDQIADMEKTVNLMKMLWVVMTIHSDGDDEENYERLEQLIAQWEAAEATTQ